MKRIIAFILCILFCFTVLLSFTLSASAVGLTETMVASAAYAIGQTFGMTFTNAAWNDTGTMNMMEGEISTYCGSRSITEVFGTEAMRAVAGKILVGHVEYNAIINFLEFINQKYNLGVNRVGLGFMFADDYGPLNENAVQYLNGWSIEATPGTTYWSTKWVGPDGRTKSTQNNSVFVNSYDYVGASYATLAAGIQAVGLYSNSLGATTTRVHGTLAWSDIYPNAADRPSRVYATSTGDITSATVLNPGYGWAGRVNGYEGPDTNLDQMIEQVFQDVADTNLDVDGEVIPLDPPQPVETWVPVDDVIDGINQGGEVITDIGNDIGDISGHLDDLGEIGGDIVDELEGVNQGIQTQTGTLTGAINQAVSDVQDAISEQTQTLSESASATAEATETIAEALEDEAIDWQKFDLRGFFPFCIPFDIYNMLEALDASPTAPHVQLPFVIESIGVNYTIDLDFSAFDPVAAVMRQMELIVYGIALAWATSKVIKW